VRLSSIGVRNVLRNRARTILTILGVSIAIVTFVMLRTVLSAWTAAADFASPDRIVTRHKVSFIMQMPGKYVTEITQNDAIQSTSAANWFGGKEPNRPDEFFGSMAVDKQFLEVYDEVGLEPGEKEAWLEDRTGALVGLALAKKFGWKVGDRVTLRGTIYPGDWPFTIRGIYKAKRRSIDQASLFFHYDYLNEWVKQNRPVNADQIGWIASRIQPGKRPADVAKALDAQFEERDVQTLSQDEHSFNTSFLGMISAVLKALDVVSVVILLIMMLILGNTIAMGVRERTHEYGVLRAIGFLPKHIALFVLGEAATVSFIGGAVGLLVAYPFVQEGMGRFLEENMGQLFPFVRINPAVAGTALVLAVALGLLAAALPAYRASKLEVVTSLRKVG
jgi:putative ABC transport system permease protein